MDSQFLELWGNFLIAAAKGHKQMEDMARWTKAAGAGPDEWTAMFRRCYGLGEEAKDSNAWQQAAEQFRSSLKDWLALMNVVPKSELEALQRKCSLLEKKTADQQNTIRHLQDLVGQKGFPLSDSVRDFSRLMEKQSKEFQKLMGNVGRAMGADQD